MEQCSQKEGEAGFLFCAVYLKGVFDGLLYGRWEAGAASLKLCMPLRPVAPQEMADAVVKFQKVYPAESLPRPAAGLATMALLNAFPCRPGQVP